MKSFFLRSLPALAVMLATTSSIAQTGNIAVNNDGAAPNAKAILDVSSNYGIGLIQKGMLIPRMNLTQRGLLGAPGTLPQGLLVYMTTGVAATEGFYYIEYGQWMKVDRSANNWDLLGNNVSNPVNDFFGTRDNTDVTFRTSGTTQMTLKGTVGARYLGINTTTPAEMVDVNGAMRIYQTPAIVPPHQFTATTTTPGVIMFRPAGVALGDSLFATYVPPVGPPTQNIDALMWNGHWGQTGATSWIQAGQDANSGTWKKLENDYEERFTKLYTQQGTPTCVVGGSVEIPTGVLPIATSMTATSGLSAFQQSLITPYPNNSASRIRHQHMFLRNELNVELNQTSPGGSPGATGGLCAGQPITSLAWYNGTFGQKATSAFVITIKHVAFGLNDLSAGFDNSIDPAQACYAVVAVVTRPILPMNAWETFTPLSVPFVWDGVRNVVIDVAYATTGTTVATGSVKFAPTPGAALLTASWNSASAAAPCANVGAAGSCGVAVASAGMPWNNATCGALGAAGGTLAYRPVIRFNGTVSTTAPATSSSNSYIYYRGGMVLEATTSPAPWGRTIVPYSFRGPGTICAEKGVYDNGTELNDHVFDRAFDGAVNPKDAAAFGDGRNMDIDEMARFTRTNRHLPTMKGRDSWRVEGGFSLGDLTNQLWTTAETQALYMTELNDRLDVIELLSNDRPLEPVELGLAKKQLCSMGHYTEAEKAALIKTLEARTITTNQR